MLRLMGTRRNDRLTGVEVELLYFDGCPNHEAVLARLHDLVEQVDPAPDIVLRRVADDAAAQRRQARWLDTLGCGSPSRSTSSPTESSPSARNSSRIRTRRGSPKPRKYLATRSLAAGESGRPNGMLRW